MVVWLLHRLGDHNRSFAELLKEIKTLPDIWRSFCQTDLMTSCVSTCLPSSYRRRDF